MSIGRSIEKKLERRESVRGLPLLFEYESIVKNLYKVRGFHVEQTIGGPYLFLFDTVHIFIMEAQNRRAVDEIVKFRK